MCCLTIYNKFEINNIAWKNNDSNSELNTSNVKKNWTF